MKLLRLLRKHEKLAVHFVFHVWSSVSEDSVWTAALVDADVTTAGTADSFIKVANIKRTRKAHQVTVSTLYVVLQIAYAKYQQDLDDDD